MKPTCCGIAGRLAICVATLLGRATVPRTDHAPHALVNRDRQRIPAVSFQIRIRRPFPAILSLPAGKLDFLTRQDSDLVDSIERTIK